MTSPIEHARRAAMSAPGLWNAMLYMRDHAAMLMLASIAWVIALMALSALRGGGHIDH